MIRPPADSAGTNSTPADYTLGVDGDTLSRREADVTVYPYKISRVYPKAREEFFMFDPVTSENGGYRVGLLIFGIRYYEAAGVGRCRQTASVPPVLNIVVRLEGDKTSGRLGRHELDPGSPRLSGRYEPWRQL